LKRGCELTDDRLHSFHREKGRGLYHASMARKATRRRVGRPTLEEGPALTLDQLVSTALRIAERDGFDAITFKRIEAALGVTARAIYHHVGSKHTLQELMVAEIQRTRPPLSIPDDTPWDLRLRAMALSSFEAVYRYPGVAVYLLTNPGAGWSETRRGDEEYTLRALLDAGFDLIEAQKIQGMLGSFVLGITQFVAALQKMDVDQLGAADRESFLAMRRSMVTTSKHELPKAFLEGLDVFIDGIRARAPVHGHSRSDG
jgi:AcrR family transcriptional regulator